jgi:ubiquitin-conjugating enzyme E2 O
MFVKEHFQKRGHCILRACDAYMKGAQVGSLSEDYTLPSNVGAESENQSTTSTGFKLMLLKIVPKLILAFSDLGVDCQEFQHSIAKESKGLCGL